MKNNLQSNDKRNNPCLYIVVPCFNEEEVLPKTSYLFANKLIALIDSKRVSSDSRILFVDDGSKDKTWEIIQQLAVRDCHYQGISLSRNRGHQNALLAGLMEVKDYCDITITIDCDGQDDVDVMDAMVDAYLDDCEIVYGVRINRDSDTTFKRVTAEGFYKLMNWLGAEVIYNHADYRLISSKALQELAKFQEVNLFLRGLIPLMGFKSVCVGYERQERAAGSSHYPLKKMLSLAVDGITSFSVKPIRLITAFGMFVAIFSFIGVAWALISSFLGHAVTGWTSIICIICLGLGIQLLCLGVIGEYVGKIYLETKARPKFIIGNRTHNSRLSSQ